ncbi:hypothetical protein CLAIMM_01984 [Cladophialophora immunda]|nr:hypothetical protein CLAIMM_01984 [Cladophialophora immunda]
MSYSDLKGKTFIITGANSGQGRATALLLASQGANLGLLDIVKPDNVVTEVENLKAKALAFKVDVTVYSQVEEAVKATADHFGGIDGAANLAGTIGTQGWKGTGYSLDVIEDPDWDFMLGVNLNGVKNSIKAEFRHIKDNGSIVNASSIAGQIGSATNAPYGAAKWGVIGLSKSAAQQGGPRGIRVNAVAPGFINTPLLHAIGDMDKINQVLAAKTALKRVGQPEEVSKLIVFLLSEVSSYITGSTINIDGGYQARQEVLDKIEQEQNSSTPWYKYPQPEEYRKARREGTHGFPKPVLNEKATLIKIAGRDGHQIELRIIKPETKITKGVWLHFHAGGFVIGSNASYDPYLTELSEALGLTMVSVEYRLAPEHPHPAALHDCVDAALYALSDEGTRALGSSLKVLGGESAGGWLSVSVALTLRDQHAVDVRSRIAAICSGYGIFDLSFTPSVLSHQRSVFLSKEHTEIFTETAFENMPIARRKQADVSPLYADLHNLPPAHFLVGTVDPLLDDSIFMAIKWQQAGNEVQVDVVDQGFHAFTLYRFNDTHDEGLEKLISFLDGKLK